MFEVPVTQLFKFVYSANIKYQYTKLTKSELR